MKIKNISLLILTVALLVVSVAAVGYLWDGSFVGNSPSVVSGANVSGSINLSIQVLANSSVSDVNFMWTLSLNSFGGSAANNSVMANISATNTTFISSLVAGPNNDTYFNVSPNFDTTTLPDGIYNITIMIFNASPGGDNASSGGVGQTVNKSHIFNYTLIVGVDNTKPLVIFMTGAGDVTSQQNFTLSSFNKTFNISIKDISIHTAQGNSAPGLVVFAFDNATGNNFNISGDGAGTPVNQSGYWSLSLNVSALHAGKHTVTVHVNDTSGNANRTVSLIFNVNTPHNVTWFEDANTLISGQNFSARNTTIYFNVSVLNATPLSDLVGGILMFDNASGNAFNVSNGSNIVAGQYFNFSYNVSALAEGTHTITLFVNDTFGNVNRTELITFVVDKTGPSITVTCTDSPAAASTVTCTCSATDPVGIAIGAAFQKGGTATTTHLAGSTSTSGTSSICTATDKVGNRNTGTGSWTVSSASTGGSGTGGSGGGTSSGVTGQSAKKTWSSINAGETATLDVKNGAIGVTKVTFDVSEIIYGAWVSVTKKDSLPSSVAIFTGKAYKNLQIIKSSTVKDDKINNLKISFKVANSWLASNSLTSGDVAMHRFADGKWTQLSTTLGTDDGTYTHYTATTPGFSYFVIGEKEAAAAPTTGAPADAPGADTADTGAVAGEEAMEDKGDAMAKETGGMTLIWIIVGVVLLLLILWWWMKKK